MWVVGGDNKTQLVAASILAMTRESSVTSNWSPVVFLIYVYQSYLQEVRSSWWERNQNWQQQEKGVSWV